MEREREKREDERKERHTYALRPIANATLPKQCLGPYRSAPRVPSAQAVLWRAKRSVLVPRG